MHRKYLVLIIACGIAIAVAGLVITGEYLIEQKAEEYIAHIEIATVIEKENLDRCRSVSDIDGLKEYVKWTIENAGRGGDNILSLLVAENLLDHPKIIPLLGDLRDVRHEADLCLAEWG